MKKIIITATVLISTVALTVALSAQGVKQQPSAKIVANYKVVAIDNKNDVGSAD